MPHSCFRVPCIALVGTAVVLLQPTSSESVEQRTANRGELNQLKPIKKALASKAVKGDKKPAVAPEERWYVLLLREEHRVPYSETHGSIRETGVRIHRNVQYLKVKGLDATARAVLNFMSGPVLIPRVFAGRDFGAQYFATEEDADAFFAANVGAGLAAGAKPSEPRSGTTEK
jgi:hypothetical protein